MERDDDGSGSHRRLRVHLRLQAEPGLPFGLFWSCLSEKSGFAIFGLFKNWRKWFWKNLRKIAICIWYSNFDSSYFDTLKVGLDAAIFQDFAFLKLHMAKFGFFIDMDLATLSRTALASARSQQDNFEGRPCPALSLSFIEDAKDLKVMSNL